MASSSYSYSLENGSPRGGRRENRTNGSRSMDFTGYHNQRQPHRQPYATDPHLSDFLNRPGKVIVKDLFSPCTQSAGGYHPGTPQTCWFKPGHVNSRIPEALLHRYVAGTAHVSLTHHICLKEFPMSILLCNKGTHWNFASLPKKLRSNSAMWPNTVRYSESQQRWRQFAHCGSKANLPISKSIPSSSTSMKHGTTQMQDDNLMQSIDRQIAQAQHELML